MARMIVNGIDLAAGQLERMGRPMIRRIVEAGAKAASGRMSENTRARGHVRTGDMLRSIRGGEYREFFDGGAIEVYPQENDRHGTRNATKAYVINYGRGGVRRRGRMGDKFITGDKGADDIVREAMQAESDRLIENL